MKLKKEIKIDETNIDLETVVNDCIYSTSEKVIGKWIDGKPLYRKTLYINSLPNHTTMAYPTNISNLKIVTKLLGIAIGTTGHCFPLPYIGRFNDGLNDIELTYLTSGDIRIITQSDRSSLYAYVTLEYTKTTD